jgi:glutamate-1-semialdehyde aminotransferase
MIKIKKNTKKINSGITLWNKAKKIIPGGNQLLSKRAELFLPNKWPAYYQKAKGIQVWDMDGNKYSDYSIMGIGACTLGYADSAVDNAVKSAIDLGCASTLNSYEEVSLAEKLLNIHPWAGMVRFAKTGGEINAIAIRIARAFSKKDIVAFCGYHGWPDWYLSANLSNEKGLDGQLLPGLQPNGVPRSLKGTALPFHYGNIDELQEIINGNPNHVGVIMMEIARYSEPDIDFVKKVQDIAKKNKIVLIFDEISSGFRASTGGMHMKYKLQPDLVTLGKALGNGYPITALIGKSKIMDSAQTTFISSTNWTDRVGFAAALETINQFEKNKVSEYTTNLANYLRIKLKKLFQTYGLKVDIKGMPSIIIMAINEEDPLIIKTLITQEMLKRGYLAGTIIFVSHAHKKDGCDKYLKDLEGVIDLISSAIKSNRLKDLLEDEVCHSGFARLN